MKILFSVLIVLLSYICIWAQQNENESFVSTAFRDLNKLPNRPDETRLKLSIESIDVERKIIFQKKSETDFEFDFDRKVSDVAREKKFSQNGSTEKFHWKPALIQSGIFLGLQHGFRLLQKKTRHELGGEFFNDWGKAVRNLRGWNDGDNFFTNYIAHPIQGGITGRIFVNNSERAKNQEFGKSKIYWESRLKAFAWSTFWSVQFEIGPISEATIGNVGLRRKNGYNTSSWVDLVITPIVGTGVVILEDVFEKYLLKNWIERKFKNKTVIKFFRVLLAPTTSFGSILRGKYPWWRENRPI